MFLLNLSLPEFLAIFAAISGIVVTLYLLSRARRRQVVPTLRFWVHAKQPIPSSRRRRIQQPWSLILQLVSLALLLLAISQLKLGNRETAQRDHVLLLDASSVMGAHPGSRPGTLLDEAKLKARAYVRALPASDRVMVVRADGLPSPATGMESNRQRIERAIDETRVGASALNLEQAFLFAGQIRRLHRSAGGEIVYAGPARVATGGTPLQTPGNLRVLSVDAPTENAGLIGVGARRSETVPEEWNIFISVHNYGSSARRIPVIVQFGGAPVGSTLLDVRPNTTESYTMRYRTRAAGWIEARLLIKDALADDNRAILELPPLKLLNVAVYTDEPDTIRPVLAANPQVRASYHLRSEYKTDDGAQVIIADWFPPVPEPKAATVYFRPKAGSPFHVRTEFTEPRAVRWRAEHEITRGIRSRDQRIPAGQILSPAKGDIPIGEVEGGPVALVRPDKRSVALGFNPGETDLKFDLTTPLLLANILRWMEPDVFRTAEVHGISVGAVRVAMDSMREADSIRVLEDGQEIPYTVRGDSLRFFSGAPGVVRVVTGDREQVYSLSLPEVADQQWTAPGSAKRGVPSVFAQAVSRDLWRILAVAGTLGLLTEWLIYGRRRLMSARASEELSAATTGNWRKAS